MSSQPRSIALYGIGGSFLIIFGLLFGLAMCGATVQIAEDHAAQQPTTPDNAQLRTGSVPLPYRHLIINAAETCPEVSAPLLAAQIDQESNWDRLAVSPAGAQGIAQFMPGTWANIGRDENGDGRASPFDPEDAIAAQARYMCTLVDELRAAQIPGDIIDLALAAYNAGPGAVREHNGIPPYTETQSYVPAIRERMLEYAQFDSNSDVTWVYPLINIRGTCTSPYGPRAGEMHNGLDIAQSEGTPIAAAADGTVIASGPASGYGLWVKIQHAGGIVTIYGHINEALVEVGQRVQAGEQIATLGNRGQSTGPHLHFQIENEGVPVNPETFYSERGGPELCDA